MYEIMHNKIQIVTSFKSERGQQSVLLVPGMQDNMLSPGSRPHHH